jgi:hypothetical protein
MSQVGIALIGLGMWGQRLAVVNGQEFRLSQEILQGYALGA